MNTLFLQNAAAGTAGTGGNWSFLVMMLLIFVVMWLFMIRPQQKKQKEINNWRNSLKKGDRIVTVGGIYGTVVEVKEIFLIIEVTDGVKLRVDKSSVVRDTTDLQTTK